MKEDQKEQVALFRHGIIAEFVNGSLQSRRVRGERIRELASKKWTIPCSIKTHVSASTIRRWIRIYTASGCKLTSLYPQVRSDKARIRALDDETCATLTTLRKELSEVTIPHLMDEIKSRKLLPAGKKISQSTVYRFLHNSNLMGKNASVPTDRRKFEAEYPNDLWQSDVMHGPRIMVNDRQRKAYLIGIIDDHSRLIPHCEFYLSENLATYLSAFEQALSKRGLPKKLYVDNGAAFKSRKLEYVCASLNIALIHAKPYQPQGKGKIERFFRTVRTRFLPGFSGQTLEDLNRAFNAWLQKDYHQKKHSATGQTPFARFTANMECLRPIPDDLKSHFRTLERWRVAKDRTVSLNGKYYQAPVELIGKRVELLFHPDEDRVEIRYKCKSHGYLAPQDVHINCRVKRDRNREIQPEFDQKTTKYSSGKLL